MILAVAIATIFLIIIIHPPMILAVTIASICLIIIIHAVEYYKARKVHKIYTNSLYGRLKPIEYKGKKKKSKRERKLENERRLRK